MNFDHTILGLLLTALAYLVGSVVFVRYSLSKGFKLRDASWILFAGLFAGIMGAKLSRLLLAAASGASPEALLAHPDGRSIVGGILLGWVGVEFAKDRLKIKRSTGDGFALALSAGEAIGRIGCYFNECCMGVVCATSTPFAVYQAGAWRHPAQFYSAFISLSIFLLLLLIRKKVRYEGDLFRVYLLCFGIGRFVLEFFRVRSELYFGLSVAQWVSLEIAASMLIAIFWIYRKSNSDQSNSSNANEALTNESM